MIVGTTQSNKNKKNGLKLRPFLNIWVNDRVRTGDPRYHNYRGGCHTLKTLVLRRAEKGKSYAVLAFLIMLHIQHYGGC
jgi:hypothetical protein